MTRLQNVLRSKQLAGWAGQGVISATNFIMLLMVAHWGGMHELGYYSLGFSIVAIMVAAQDSLVTRPYAIQLFRPPGGAKAHAYGTLMFGIILSAAMAIGFLAASLLIGAWAPDRQLAAVFLVLAASAPLVLLRDFARRFCFANLHMHQALVIDIATGALVLMSMTGVALAGTLGASTALLCYSAAGGAAGAVWLMFSRRSFEVRRGAVRDTARQSWTLGKWLMLSQVTLQFQSYAAHWLILMMAGAAATGVYTACLSIVGLSNPFLFGLLNVLTPKYVRARKERGGMELRRQIVRDATMTGAVMGSFALALTIAGGMLLSLLFPGIEVEEAATTLTVLAFAAAMGSLGAPATIALSIIERGRAVAALSFASLILGFLAVVALLPVYGLVGAAWGMLLTETIGTTLRWAIFLRVTSAARAQPATEPAVEC